MRGSAEVVPNETPMETVVCGKCGQRYAIHTEPLSQNAELSRKQASFVADKLVWDHIQERKHQGTIELPSL
ncbi:MAG: hypothetical protein WA672_18660 [Candidatus Angelobacter sp.]